jgi:hypothetical protein
MSAGAANEWFVGRHDNPTSTSSARKPIMKSLKTLLLTKSVIAAAIATAGIAAPAVSHALAVGGPASGMVCRTGYTPTFNGTSLVCSKASSFELQLVCTNPTFPNYVIRVGAPDTDADICVRNGVVITSSQSLQGVPLSTNGISGSYLFATFDPAALASKTATQDQAEATALGLTANDVDTRAGTVVIRPNGRAGGKGEASVPVTHFVFATPSNIVIGGPVVTTPGPFVPRPLP